MPRDLPPKVSLRVICRGLPKAPREKGYAVLHCHQKASMQYWPDEIVCFAPSSSHLLLTLIKSETRASEAAAMEKAI